MKKIETALIVATIAIALSACGSNGTPENPKRSRDVVVDYHGSNLYCVHVSGNSGVSCDWVRYHEENQ